MDQFGSGLVDEFVVVSAGVKCQEINKIIGWQGSYAQKNRERNWRGIGGELLQGFCVLVVFISENVCVITFGCALL
jgi:hypothetical protein